MVVRGAASAEIIPMIAPDVTALMHLKMLLNPAKLVNARDCRLPARTGLLICHKRNA